MSLIMNESNFQHILRVLNTNLDGKVTVMFALTSIKGVGRRFSNIACKKLRWKKVSRAVPGSGMWPWAEQLIDHVRRQWITPEPAVPVVLFLGDSAH